MESGGSRTIFFSRWLSLFNWIVNFNLRFDILSDATFCTFVLFFIDIFPFCFVQNMNKIFILDISIKFTSVLEIIRVFFLNRIRFLSSKSSHKYWINRRLQKKMLMNFSRTRGHNAWARAIIERLAHGKHGARVFPRVRSRLVRDSNLRCPQFQCKSVHGAPLCLSNGTMNPQKKLGT